MSAARRRSAELASSYDLVIIGGGVSGAGVLREAVRTGARVLLVEQGDFASGTSSASSKLVHGGLRYLRTGQWGLTRESVRERQFLMGQADGLVEALPFLLPIYRHRGPGKLAIRLGLWIYDHMASGIRPSRWLEAEAALALVPGLAPQGLLGAMSYDDAQTDDARLTLRLLLESMRLGATACNYLAVESLLSAAGRISGVALRDAVTGKTTEVQSKMVIDASGAWAGAVAHATVAAPRLRPLRGSHFLFPVNKFPLDRAVSWVHPVDQRPIFAFPWEGAILYGTTDVDHADAPLTAPVMLAAESRYLLEGLQAQFPGLKLSAADAICSFAGVRPVVAGGKADPSAESRESAHWSAPGLVGMAGGKLTTFRVGARQILRHAAAQVPQLAPTAARELFAGAHPVESQRRSYGRYGLDAGPLLAELPGVEQQPLPGTPYSLAEMRWSARHEQVVHLDDLLLRRTRLGLVTADGGADLLPSIGPVCREELGWDDAQWQSECLRYRALWHSQHAPVRST